MSFWDSSAIVPLLVQEPHSYRVQKIAAGDQALVIWWATGVEVVSALARLERDKAFFTENMTGFLRSLMALMDGCSIVEPHDGVLQIAQRLLLAYPIKAADALQLAAALVFYSEPRRSEFVCLDRKLRDAAMREGFEIVPEIL